MRSLLRHPADRRTLLWSFLFFPVPIAAAVLNPNLALWLLPLSLYLAFCAGVLTHYHNHLGVFRHRLFNRLYSLWLSIFYGFPVFSWIPTHNQNHHKYHNGPGDHTSTAKLKNGDSFLTLLFYPTRSSAWQLPALITYLNRLKSSNSSAYYWSIAQCLVVPLAHVSFLSLLMVRHGELMGLSTYVVALLLPALFAPWSMMVINYLQHIDCDPSSDHDHSRNFVGRLENWFVFDAGLHTVHHENPGTHFSEYQRLHRERQNLVSPHLNQRNVFSFVLNRYLLEKQPLAGEQQTSSHPVA
jgi:beta-carotene hydroxylase